MSDEPGALLTCGQMARLNGVSEKTLRLYQKKGLLSPTIVNEETGFRYYTLDQSSDLDTIQRLQGIGFSLAEIRDMLSLGQVSELENRLVERSAELKKEAQHIERMINAADALLKSCSAVTRPPITDQIILEQVPPRTIVFSGTPALPPQDVPVVDKADWQMSLRTLKQELAAQGVSPELCGSAGCMIAKGALLAGDVETVIPFVFMDDRWTADLPNRRVLPGGQYLTMYYRHSFDEDGNTTIYGGIERMLDYARAKRFSVVGDYYDEIVAEGSIFGYRGCDGFIKMYIPVSR